MLSLSTVDYKLPIIVELGTDTQSQPLSSVWVRSNTPLHPPVLTTTYRLKPLSFVLVPNSNLLECHILLTSSKAKWTHNLPVNLFPYSRFHVVCAQALSRVRLFVTPWTVARQAPLSMEFSQQEYWTGLPCLSPGDLPNLGIEPRSLALQADSLPSEPSGKLFLW